MDRHAIGGEFNEEGDSIAIQPLSHLYVSIYLSGTSARHCASASPSSLRTISVLSIITSVPAAPGPMSQSDEITNRSGGMNSAGAESAPPLRPGFRLAACNRWPSQHHNRLAECRRRATRAAARLAAAISRSISQFQGRETAIKLHILAEPLPSRRRPYARPSSGPSRPG